MAVLFLILLPPFLCLAFLNFTGTLLYGMTVNPGKKWKRFSVQVRAFLQNAFLIECSFLGLKSLGFVRLCLQHKIRKDEEGQYSYMNGEGLPSHRSPTAAVTNRRSG